MKRNKRAYTIIEIIAVLSIIGIMVLLIIPAISNYLTKGTQSYYNSLENQLTLIAKDYYSDNLYELPRGQLNDEGNQTYITKLPLAELEELNYVTNDVVDKSGEICEESFVRVENVEGEYEYQTCLVCPDYVTDSPYCDVNYIDDVTAPTCSIAAEGYTTGTWAANNVTLNITGNDSDSGVTKFIVEEKIIKPVASVGTYVATASGTYEAEVVDKAGNTGTCTSPAIQIDTVNPYCDSIAIVNGADAAHKIIRVTASDAASGLATVVIGTGSYAGGGLLTKVVDHTVAANGTYAVSVTDVAGKTASCGNAVVTGIDAIPPVVTWAGPYTTSGGTTVATYSKSGSTVYYKLTAADENGIVTSTTAADITRSNTTRYSAISLAGTVAYSSGGLTGSTYTFAVTVGTGDGATNVSIAAGKVKDAAGNNSAASTAGSSTVDNTLPACGTASGASTAWTNANRTITQACSDSGSGCVSATYATTYSTTTQTGSVAIADNIGNSRTCTYNVYVDKTAPTCGAANGSSGSWTAGDRSVWQDCSDGNSGCTASSYGTWYNYTIGYGSVGIYDNAGNGTTCTYPVAVDKTPPSIWFTSMSNCGSGSRTRSGVGVANDYESLLGTIRTEWQGDASWCNSGNSWGTSPVYGTNTTQLTRSSSYYSSYRYYCACGIDQVGNWGCGQYYC